MEPARATWTDERLDDLATRMDRGFTEIRSDMDRGFERVDLEMRNLRGEMKSDVEALRTEVSTRFGSLERTIHWFGGGMLLTFAAAFLTLLLGYR
jgi:hypothetical protein